MVFAPRVNHLCLQHLCSSSRHKTFKTCGFIRWGHCGTVLSRTVQVEQESKWKPLVLLVGSLPSYSFSLALEDLPISKAKHSFHLLSSLCKYFHRASQSLGPSSHLLWPAVPRQLGRENSLVFSTFPWAPSSVWYIAGLRPIQRLSLKLPEHYLFFEREREKAFFLPAPSQEEVFFSSHKLVIIITTYSL